jgi:fatty-acyl-CoA synthase
VTETPDLLWPTCEGPDDLALIESVPLSERGLPESTYDVLARAASLWPDRTAVTVLPTAQRYDEAVPRTFGRLLHDVHQVGNAFSALGVTRGAPVALLSPNTDELLTALLAAQAVGIAAPVNPGLSPDHLVDLLTRSAAQVLVAAGPELDPDLWATARGVAQRLDVRALLALRPTGAIGDGPALEPLAGVQIDHLTSLAAAQPGERLLVVPPRADDLAAFFHTGGTTGVPKLAAHTHANEVADAWSLAVNGALDEDAVLFGALPLFHVNALVVTLLAPLLRGQHVVWAGPLGYREPALYGVFWKLVEHFRLATMSAVPTVYAVLAACPVDADISSLRFGVVGASPLPPAVRDGFLAHTGVPLCEGYGLTEATCATARSFPDHPRPDSVGQRLPYQRLRTVTIEGDGTWTQSESGVLLISGPTVFPGYVTGHRDGRPVLDSLGKVVDGWLDTGDLAKVDAHGFVRLTGRAKDLIIRGGHNIDPAVIEDALLQHPDISGASAVGRPDAHAGEVPVAYVTLRPGAQVTPRALVQWASQHVPEQAAAPKDVYLVDALPLTDVGKPYKVALRADAAERAATAALAGLDAVVTSRVVGGEVGVSVACTNAAAVRSALAPYTFAWEITEARA